MKNKARVFAMLLAVLLFLPCVNSAFAAEPEQVDYGALFQEISVWDTDYIHDCGELYDAFMAAPTLFLRALSQESERLQEKVSYFLAYYSWSSNKWTDYYAALTTLKNSEMVIDGIKPVFAQLEAQTQIVHFTVLLLQYHSDPSEELRQEIAASFLENPTTFIRSMIASSLTLRGQGMMIDFFVTPQWQEDTHQAYYHALIALAQSNKTDQAERRVINRMLQAMGETGITAPPLDCVDYAELLSHVYFDPLDANDPLAEELFSAFITDPEAFVKAVGQLNESRQTAVAKYICIIGTDTLGWRQYCEVVNNLIFSGKLSESEQQAARMILEESDYNLREPVDFADLFGRALENPDSAEIYQELESALAATPRTFVTALSQEEYDVQFALVEVFRKTWRADGIGASLYEILQEMSQFTNYTQAERRVISWLLSAPEINIQFAVYQMPVEYSELFSRTFQADDEMADQLTGIFVEVFLMDPVGFVRGLAQESAQIQKEVAKRVMRVAYYDNYDREYVRVILDTVESVGIQTAEEKALIGIMWDSVDDWIAVNGPLPQEPDPEPVDPDPTVPAPTQPSVPQATEPAPTGVVPTTETPKSGVPGWVVPSVLIVLVLGVGVVVIKALPLK